MVVEGFIWLEKIRFKIYSLQGPARQGLAGRGAAWQGGAWQGMDFQKYQKDKTMKEIKYKAKSGAPFPQEKAQEVGETLESIKKENGGSLVAEQVLEKAKNPKSKLHPYFDWKDSQAAKKWRKHQARLLINHVEVTYVHQEVEEHKPAYINIKNTSTDEENPERAYVSCVDVADNNYYREQALQDALKQLIHWKNKYKWLGELHNVMEEIRKVEVKMNNKPEKAEKPKKHRAEARL